MLMEYYIGLEVLRLLFLAIAVYHKGLDRKKSLTEFLKYWLPYPIAMNVFLFWRIFMFQGTRPTTRIDRVTNLFVDNPFHRLIGILIDWGKDLIEVTFSAWAVALDNHFYLANYRELVIGLLLAGTGIGLFLLYALPMNKNAPDNDRKTVRNSAILMILLGLVTTAFALFPAVIADREVRFYSRDDRFSLPASFGAMILIVGIIFYSIRPNLRPWLISFLLGISLLAQYNMGLHWKDYWEIQRNSWWQLTWRAPMLKEGTLLFMSLPDGFTPTEGYELWGPANMLYYPSSETVIISGEVLNDEYSQKIQQGKSDSKIHRVIQVDRNFDNALIITMPTSEACINVIDGRKFELSPYEDPRVRLVAPFSKIEAIETSQPFIEPDDEIFGSEPVHDWCYYYQKATFARQIREWDEIARLGDEASLLGYSARDISEWMPFLEAYTFTGEIKKARSIAATLKSNPLVRNPICQQLTQQTDEFINYDKQAVIDMLCASNK
jgi:hypothetical protein